MHIAGNSFTLKDNTVIPDVTSVFIKASSVELKIEFPSSHLKEKLEALNWLNASISLEPFVESLSRRHGARAAVPASDSVPLPSPSIFHILTC